MKAEELNGEYIQVLLDRTHTLDQYVRHLSDVMHKSNTRMSDIMDQQDVDIAFLQAELLTLKEK